MSGTAPTTISPEEELNQLNETLASQQKQLAALEKDLKQLDKQMADVSNRATQLSSNPLTRLWNRKELADLDRQSSNIFAQQYDKSESAKQLQFVIEDTEKTFKERIKALALSKGEGTQAENLPKKDDLNLNKEEDLGVDFSALEKQAKGTEQMVDSAKTSLSAKSPWQTVDERLEHNVNSSLSMAQSWRDQLSLNLSQTKTLEAQRDKLSSNAVSKFWNRKELEGINRQLQSLATGKPQLEKLIKDEERKASVARKELDDHLREKGMGFSKEEHLGVDFNKLNQLSGNTNATINVQQRINDAISKDPQLNDFMKQRAELEKQFNATLEKRDKLHAEWADLQQKGTAIEAQGIKGDLNALKEIEGRMDKLSAEYDQNTEHMQSLGHQSGMLKDSVAQRLKEVEDSVKNPAPKLQGQEPHHDSVREALQHEAEHHGQQGPHMGQSQPHQGVNNSAGVQHPGITQAQQLPSPQLTPEGGLKYKAPDQQVGGPQMQNSGFALEDMSRGKGLTDGAQVQQSTGKPKVDPLKHENVGERLHKSLHGHGDHGAGAEEVGVPKHQLGQGVHVKR